MVAWQDFQKCTMSISKVKKRSVTLIWNLMGTIYAETWTKEKKEVLKEAINAFDGTAIIVSHDREFLDGLVSKVYEFGGGAVREHLGIE